MIRTALAAATLTAAASLMVGGVAGATPNPVADKGDRYDNRPCISEREVTEDFYWQRRDVVEAGFEVTNKGLNGNSLFNPDNANLYSVVYPSCGYNADEMVTIIVYRKSNDVAQAAIRLNRVYPMPKPHGRP